MPRPTGGVAAALVAALVLHLLSRITGGGWLALASAAALALPVAAVLLRPRLGDLEVTSSAARARVGDGVDVSLVVRNAGLRPSPACRLVDAGSGLGPLTVAVPPLAPGAQVVAQLRRTAVERGRHAAVAFELTSTAPFGLLLARREVHVEGPFVVGPRRVPARELAAAGEGTGGSSRPVAGAGTEVLGLRPWRPGDGRRAVHARASARHGRPVVLERERDTGPSLVVLCSGGGSGPQWEAAVEQACAVAEESVRRSRPPVLLARGLPTPNRPDLGAVLDWHAALDAAQPVDAATLSSAVRAAGPGGAVLLLAPPSLVLDPVVAVRRACATTGAALTVLGRS